MHIGGSREHYKVMTVACGRIGGESNTTWMRRELVVGGEGKTASVNAGGG